MPLYEYVCKDCGFVFDAFRSFADANAPQACKKCQSKNTQRKLGTFYASSEGHAITGAGGGSDCGGCSGGSCGSCHH